jgi:drug/metabolite transporter (DMT)-like permease
MKGSPARLKADLALLTTSLIWGSAFVAQRVAAVQVGVFLFNGMRFWLAAFVLLPFIWLEQRRKTGQITLRPEILPGIALAGVLLFGGSALQQAGLVFTTASNAGFITGLYVVFIPIFMLLIWHKRQEPVIWVAAGLAAAGLFLLSTGGQLRVNPGDLLVLTSAIFWAFHVILIGNLAQRVRILPLAVGQYFICGLLNMICGIWLEAGTLHDLAGGWWAIVYTGVVSVGLGYTLQVAGQRKAPPADAAILLSMEAVFAAFFGWWLLGEKLSPVQLIGCGIMFAGMLLAQAPVLISARKLRVRKRLHPG